MMDRWIVVADYDVLSLKDTRNMLMEQNMKVSCVKSGRELLAYLLDVLL